MNELTALTVFNITDNNEDNVEERYSESCFEIKSYFLQNPAFPKLVISKLKSLQTNEEAYCCLMKKDVRFPEIILRNISLENAFECLKLKDHSWDEMFKNYNEIISEVRLKLSRSKTGIQVAENILLLGEIEISYYKVWNHFFKNINDDVIEEMCEKNPRISAQRETVLISNSISILTRSGLKNNLQKIEDEGVLATLWEKESNRPYVTLALTELFRIKKLSSHL